jgi:hypothetical protein
MLRETSIIYLQAWFVIHRFNQYIEKVINLFSIYYSLMVKGKFHLQGKRVITILLVETHIELGTFKSSIRKRINEFSGVILATKNNLMFPC